MFKKNYVFAYVFCITFLLSACGNDENVNNRTSTDEVAEGGLIIPLPRALIASRIDLADFDLEMQVNSFPVTPTRSNDAATWSAIISVEEGFPLDVQVVWSAFGIDVATGSHSEPNVSTNLQIVFNSDSYTLLDDDGDSFSNIDEIDNGTDESDPNSFPGQTGASPFNSNQLDCATPDLFRQAANGGQFTDVDGTTVLPIPDLVLADSHEPISLAVGSNVIIEPPVSSTDLYLFELINVQEAGTLTISHVSGYPNDSFAELFDRDLTGGLNRIDFNDDSNNTLNAELSVDVNPGGYCFLLRHFSGFALLAGVDIGPTRIQYRLD